MSRSAFVGKIHITSVGKGTNPCLGSRVTLWQRSRNHACSMRPENWRRSSHLKVTRSRGLPGNFRTFEACRSFAGTAGVTTRIARREGSCGTRALCDMVTFPWCPVPSPGLWSIRNNPLRQLSAFLLAWELCSALPSTTAQGITLKTQGHPFLKEAGGTGDPATQHGDVF